MVVVEDTEVIAVVATGDLEARVVALEDLLVDLLQVMLM